MHNKKMRCRTLHRCVDWNAKRIDSQDMTIASHPSRVCGVKYRYISTKLISFIKEIKDGWNIWSWKSCCRFKSSNLQIRFCIACRIASQGDAAFFYMAIEFAAPFRGRVDEVWEFFLRCKCYGWLRQYLIYSRCLEKLTHKIDSYEKRKRYYDY